MEAAAVWKRMFRKRKAGDSFYTADVDDLIEALRGEKDGESASLARSAKIFKRTGRPKPFWKRFCAYVGSRGLPQVEYFEMYGEDKLSEAYPLSWETAKDFALHHFGMSDPPNPPIATVLFPQWAFYGVTSHAITGSRGNRQLIIVNGTALHPRVTVSASDVDVLKRYVDRMPPLRAIIVHEFAHYIQEVVGVSKIQANVGVHESYMENAEGKDVVMARSIRDAVRGEDFRKQAQYRFSPVEIEARLAQLVSLLVDGIDERSACGITFSGDEYYAMMGMLPYLKRSYLADRKASRILKKVKKGVDDPVVLGEVDKFRSGTLLDSKTDYWLYHQAATDTERLLGRARYLASGILAARARRSALELVLKGK